MQDWLEFWINFYCPSIKIVISLIILFLLLYCTPNVIFCGRDLPRERIPIFTASLPVIPSKIRRSNNRKYFTSSSWIPNTLNPFSHHFLIQYGRMESSKIQIIFYFIPQGFLIVLGSKRSWLFFFELRYICC